MYCRNCGNELKEEMEFCTNCGASVKEDISPKEVNRHGKKSKKIKFSTWLVIILIITIVVFASILIAPKIIKQIQDNIQERELQEDLENIDIRLNAQELIIPYQGLYNERLFENTYNIDLEHIDDYLQYKEFVEDYRGGTLEITGNIDIGTIGEYEINFVVKSEKGNSKTDKIIVKVQDMMKPEIYVENDTIEIKKGTEVNILEGITASDNVDSEEELKSKIITEGTVDVNTVGEYKITYKVKDNAGWSDERTRTYKVIEKKNITIGKEYTYTYKSGGETFSKVLTFSSNNKVSFLENHWEGRYSTGTYTIKDDIITAKVETDPNDEYMGGYSQTLKLKLQDNNTLKDISTGHIYK